jgi:hypothetical protein
MDTINQIEAGKLLAEDLLAYGLLQQLKLKVQFLILSRNPRVADQSRRRQIPIHFRAVGQYHNTRRQDDYDGFRRHFGAW